MITFSAYREEDTVAQIQALLRASDPLFELMFQLNIGHKMEDDFWMQTLRNLANHFKAAGSEPELRGVVVDPRLQWSEAKNIWHMPPFAPPSAPWPPRCAGLSVSLINK